MKNKSITYILSMIAALIFSVSSANAADTDSRKTYAVVWTINTDDGELFNSTIGLHATKVLELWRDGIVENVYLDVENTHNDIRKGDTARVMFFIKAKTDVEAKSILDELPLVKNKAAVYSLSRVGALWLTQY